MTNNVNEAVQAIREIAITEIMLNDSPEMKKAVSDYIEISTYNSINGKNTTIENAEIESIKKVDLAKIMKEYEVIINKKMIEILARY